MTADQSRRNRDPYTPVECALLKALHAQLRKTTANSYPGSPERVAGDLFAAMIAEKRREGFTWAELGDPLGIAARTLNAYMSRRNPDPDVEPSRPKMKGVSEKRRTRKPGYFPCGIHQIGVDPEYPPARPGGPPRDKTCELEARRERYTQLKAKRAAGGDSAELS